ncbi:MAG: diacylglycerol kinase family lipid kinase [Pyrinomonadaceae bacterium]|jgi:YegS/Rv2252/BmrU family lipid kinase|nr:diacylglycerol kinase family lipid kinase [Pyrinomonadaceae bacterium]
MTSQKRSVVLISNPQAGRTGARRVDAVLRFCRHLKKRGVEVEVMNTTGPGDAACLAKQAVSEGWREVIVSGGDGTINEALQGLVGTDARLAIWPRGTANVLARELRLPFNIEALAEVIAQGKTRRISVGCATAERTGEERYFFLMAGVGLDASIVHRVPPRLKKLIGEAAFWYSGLGHLADWEPAPFSVEVEGSTFPATFAAFGKAPRYGGRLAITPRARLDQTEFEICIVDSISRLHYLYLLSHAMRNGVAENATGVRFIRTRRARAEGSALVQVDGELIGQLPMTFEMTTHSIEVVAAF